ncbi:MAG: CoA-binding protein [Chloroflexi bacterium]|nr:CoA-binding protein [Chloroflexota bacterium]
MSLIAPLLQTSHTFAIVGASQDRNKYGYEVFDILTRHGHTVLPINPKYADIDGVICYPSLPDLPRNPDVVLTAAPAIVSEQIARTCAAQRIPIFWMPPGTETDAALEICKQNDVTAIHGYCPVFVLKLPRERWVELP